MTIRYDDRVAIVTGSGAGLGRSHAMLLASRGAKVVVNDPGGAVDGRGGQHAVADTVVAEIKGAGGGIVVTTSRSGTVGNFGQANYGAAKMAVNGLINVLRFEGAKYNIRINAISPSALTRMTESLLPPDIAPYMKPELVSPAVAWLCSEECDQNGEIIAATAGGYARVQYFVTEGAQFDPAEPVTIEMVRDSLGKI